MVDFVCTADMTKEMAISAAHKATAVPGMIILYLLMGVILFLAGWAFKDRDSSWGRFFWIWATTMLEAGVFLIFLIYSPETIQWLLTKWEIMW